MNFRSLYLIVMFSALLACGGGSSQNESVIEEPATSNRVTVINSSNAEKTLLVGASTSEAVYVISVFAMNHLSELAEKRENSVDRGCHDGVTSIDLAAAANSDLDGSGDLSSQDVINVSTGNDCYKRIFQSYIEGDFDIILESVYLANDNNAIFKGLISLTPDFKIYDDGPSNQRLVTTIEGNINFSLALRDNNIQSLQLSIDDGNDLTFKIGDDLSGFAYDRITQLSFSRRTYPIEKETQLDVSREDLYEINFSSRIDSDLLDANIACETLTTITGIVGSKPLSGRYICKGSSESFVSIDSERESTDFPIAVEFSIEVDGTPSSLSGGDFFWDDFLDGSLFYTHPYGISNKNEVISRASEELDTFSATTAEINDIIYNSYSDSLYISNLSGVVELDPETLEVRRSVNVSDNPSAIAISDDGSTLWYGLNNTDEFGSIDLATMQLGERFKLGFSEVYQSERKVDDIVVVPNTTTDIVLTTDSWAEVIAYKNGVMLPNYISGFDGASELVFRNASSLVGVDDESTAYTAYVFDYDNSTGLAIREKLPDISPGFDSPLQLGSENIWSAKGYSFNEIKQTMTGKVNGELVDFVHYEYVVVDPTDKLVYAIDTSVSIIEIFDELTHARVGAYRFSSDLLAGRSLKAGLVTKDYVIFASSSQIIKFSKGKLSKNIDSGACVGMDVGALLVDSDYKSFGCQVQDMEYDDQQNLIYAALPGAIGPQGNSLAIINPDTLSVQKLVRLPGDPNTLNISDDGSILSIAYRFSSIVSQIDLHSQSLLKNISLGFDSHGGERGDLILASAAQTRPGSLNEVAVLSDRRIGLYVDGIREPTDAYYGSWNDLTKLFFDEQDTSRLFIVNNDLINTYQLNGSGLDYIEDTEEILDSRSVVRRGNYVLDGQGQEFNISTFVGRQVCDFEYINFYPKVATFGVSSDMAFFAESEIDHRFYLCNLSTGKVDDLVRVPFFFGEDIDPYRYIKGGRKLFQVTSGDLLYLYGSTLIKLSLAE